MKYNYTGKECCAIINQKDAFKITVKEKSDRIKVNVSFELEWLHYLSETFEKYTYQEEQNETYHQRRKQDLCRWILL